MNVKYQFLIKYVEFNVFANIRYRGNNQNIHNIVTLRSAGQLFRLWKTPVQKYQKKNHKLETLKRKPVSFCVRSPKGSRGWASSDLTPGFKQSKGICGISFKGPKCTNKGSRINRVPVQLFLSS